MFTSLKKYIALLSIFVLLIPSVIQIAHAFEEHEHIVCTSKYDQHFHQDDADCAEMHYQLKVFNHTFSTDYDLVSLDNFKSRFNLKPQFNSVSHVVKRLPRAPPCNLVNT
ncbi:hypothetical protein [uncultured Tenacibaculum sp.]|uniref:hypothetical protein n=1 Tax=uncultured Tenacibaculum sp. TaxID=174713 RepID=UPI00262EE8D3|nr:hypothetical protein [uncultured Tenacibaculum sp.]